MTETASLGSNPPLGGEVTLFQEEGVLVTSQRVSVRGHSWPLGDVQRAYTAHHAPRLWPLVLALVLGMGLGLPLLHAALAGAGAPQKGYYEAALVLVALGAFGSIGRLLLAEDTYWLVLRTPRGEHRVLASPNHQLVNRLAAVVTEGAACQRI